MNEAAPQTSVSLASAGGLAHREGDGNGGADAFGAGNGDVAAVLDDDAADAGETETGAGEAVEDVGTAAEALENERERYAGGGFCPALSCGIGSSGVPEGAVSENGRFRQGVGDHPRGRPPSQRATLSARYW